MSEMALPWPQSTFTTATDERLSYLIRNARERIVVVAPALTKQVAEALCHRLRDEGRINVTIVLDADPEVYRFGYGDIEALTMLQEAADRNWIGLARQEGVRIGVVAADAEMIIYSPTPKLIEAGSTSVQKPNAIQLGGSVVDNAAAAVGASTDSVPGRHEIGHLPLEPAEVQKMMDDLTVEPPQPFDIARQGRVFSSKLQYVELKVQNSRFSSRRVPLPPELINVADQRLKDRITSGVKPPADAFGPFNILIEQPDGKTRKQSVDERWLTRERERIEQAYTFELKGFGRVILRSEQGKFENEVERFKRNLDVFRVAVNDSLEKEKVRFAKVMAAEFLPRWKQRPPEYMTRLSKPTAQDLKEELERICSIAVGVAFSFDAPEIRKVYKDIAPASARDNTFLAVLRTAMEKKRIPLKDITKMFAEWNAAPAPDSLFGW